jgi:3-hydroxybutyryl-CoA dehydratase
MAKEVMMSATTTDGGPSDLKAGIVLESEYVEITQDMINTFAELSGDKNPIHLDVEFARKMGMRGTIAHGALVFSRATGLAYGFGLLVKNTVVFKEAHLHFRVGLFAGDRMKIQMRINSVTPKRALQKVEARITVINQDSLEVHWYDLVAIARTNVQQTT